MEIRDPANIFNPTSRLREHTAGLMSIILSNYWQVYFSGLFFSFSHYKSKTETQSLAYESCKWGILNWEWLWEVLTSQDCLRSEAQREKLHVSLLTTYRLLTSSVVAFQPSYKTAHPLFCNHLVFPRETEKRKRFLCSYSGACVLLGS